MKRTTKTLITLLSFSFLACSGPAVKKTSEANGSQARTPASTSEASPAWGRPVSPEAVDFLEEIENAPNGRYPGNKVP